MIHPLEGEDVKPLEKAFEEVTKFELMRRFASPLEGKPFREFEFLPLCRRGVAQLVEHSSPKKSAPMWYICSCCGKYSITEAKVIKARPHLILKGRWDGSMVRKV